MRKAYSRLFIMVSVFILTLGLALAATPSFTQISTGISWFKDNVGFGTDNPQEAIDVIGNIKTDESLIFGNDSINVANTYPGVRILTSNQKTEVNVCDAGCDYTSINAALADLPLVLKQQYIVWVESNYTGNESVFVPPYSIGYTTSTEGANWGLQLKGRVGEVRPQLNSIQVTGVQGSNSPVIKDLHITGQDPHSDENVGIALYGVNHALLYNLTFDGSTADLGVLLYGSEASLAHIDLGTCDMDNGIQTKHGGSTFDSGEGLVTAPMFTGSVKLWVMFNAGGNPMQFMQNDATGNCTGAMTDDASRPKGTTEEYIPLRGLIHDAKSHQVYGIDKIPNELNITNSLNVEDSAGDTKINFNAVTDSYINEQRVGLNTTSPGALLHLSGGKLALQNGGKTFAVGNSYPLIYGAKSGGDFSQFGDLVLQTRDTNGPGNSIYFVTSASSGPDATTQMDIDGNGWVNIRRLQGTYTGGSAYVCVFDNGNIYASDTACP